MATYQDFKRQIAELERKAANARKIEVSRVIVAIRKQIAEFDLTPDDLFKNGGKATRVAQPRKVVKKAANPPKYEDPVTGKTWTGHGKKPGWIADAISKGASKDDFLIGKAAATSKPAKAKKPAAKTAKARPAAKKPKAVAPAASEATSAGQAS